MLVSFVPEKLVLLSNAPSIYNKILVTSVSSLAEQLKSTVISSVTVLFIGVFKLTIGAVIPLSSTPKE